MKIVQQILVRLNAYIFCKHAWQRMRHHGLPGEPYFMFCKKCQRITKLDHYLTDTPSKPNTKKDTK